MDAVDSRLRMVFYQASDGPRLLIFGSIQADVGSLQEVFMRLSKSPGERCQLHAQGFVMAYGGVLLSLICTGPEFPLSALRQRKGFRRVGGPESVVFEWHLACEGWDYLAALIASSVKSATPGHQYLTSYPGQDAIVVVSKGEYDQSILDDILPAPHGRVER